MFGQLTGTRLIGPPVSFLNLSDACFFAWAPHFGNPILQPASLTPGMTTTQLVRSWGDEIRDRTRLRDTLLTCAERRGSCMAFASGGDGLRPEFAELLNKTCANSGRDPMPLHVVRFSPCDGGAGPADTLVDGDRASPVYFNCSGETLRVDLHNGRTEHLRSLISPRNINEEDLAELAKLSSDITLALDELTTSGLAELTRQMSGEDRAAILVAPRNFFAVNRLITGFIDWRAKHRLPHCACFAISSIANEVMERYHHG